MAVHIIKTDYGYQVNGKPISKDKDEQWIAVFELTQQEKEQFHKHIQHHG